MPPMSGKTFLDTNIVVYLYSGDEPEKRAVAHALIEQNNPVVSTQVLSELANTLSRKFGLSYEVVEQAVAEVRDACSNLFYSWSVPEVSPQIPLVKQQSK
jgi:predicted nucleic acid-binding protein